MDSLPPPPPVLAPVPAPSPPSYGPGDIYPQTGPHAQREQELCDSASSPDWIYLAGLLALDVGSIWVESEWNNAGSLGVRLIAPGSVGLTWGATLGGGYLALPKCDKNWVSFPPREGDVRADWPAAVAIAGLAAISAPVIVGIVQGSLLQTWTTDERFGHLASASGMAIAGALLPYLLPPKTWRAAKELQHIRASTDGRSAYLSYTLSF